MSDEKLQVPAPIVVNVGQNSPGLGYDQKRALETGLDYLRYLTDPDRIAESQFHAHLPKDLSISQLTEKKQVDYVLETVTCVNGALALGAIETAKEYSSELVAFLSAMKSWEGFERRQENTQIIKQQQELTTNENKGKKGLF
jgi:hypothetical protein